MTPNDQPNVSDGPTKTVAPVAPPARSLKFKLAALGLVLVSGITGLGLAHCLIAPPTSAPPSPPSPAPEVKLPPYLFQGWTKPDFVLVLSGEQHGYLMPCGCSHPQKGGLERRYNFLELLKAKGWPVVAADLGDVPQIQGPAGLPNIQGLIKYKYSMESFKRMDYAAASFGKYEALLSLDTIFGEWALNEPKPPLLAANLADKSGVYKDIVQPLAIKHVQAAGVNVGIGGLIGPMIGEEIEKKDANFTFAAGSKTLPPLLKQMDAKKADFRVLLFQGMKGRKPEAIAMVEAFPQFNVVLCLSESDEPRSTPVTIGKTMVVSVGHKGRYVGVVGVWKTNKGAQPYELKYQLVELGEEFLTPKGEAANHKIVALMEQYKRQLRDENYLGKYPQVTHPNEIAAGKGNTPEYIGSDNCKNCHADAYKKWTHTPHSHAYQTLVDAKEPALNQFDPECIVCHTVGFGHKTGFRDATTTPKLLNVGCESCHGPGSEHRDAEQLLQASKPSPKSQPWRDLMNPWRTPDEPETPLQRDKRVLRADGFCQSCHDKDNDVTWLHKAFERKWLKIWHYEEREQFKNRAKLIEEFTRLEAEQKKQEAEEKKKATTGR